MCGVSLFGQTILPSQITSAAMVSFGASKNAVVLWQVISIIIWGVVFGALAIIGVMVLRQALPRRQLATCGRKKVIHKLIFAHTKFRNRARFGA